MLIISMLIIIIINVLHNLLFNLIWEVFLYYFLGLFLYYYFFLNLIVYINQKNGTKYVNYLPLKICCGKITINSWGQDSSFLEIRIRKMRFTLDLCSSFLITVFPKPLRKLARFPFRVPLMYCSSRGGTERCIVKPEMGNAGHCCLGTFVQNVMRYRLTK